MSVNHELRVVEGVAKLLEKDSFNDVTIVTSNGQVKANKVILCATSEYFATRICNNNIFTSKEQVVTIEETNKGTMELVLRYLYTGKMEYEDLNLREYLDLLWLLKTMELLDLFSTIEKYLIENIREETYSFEKLLLTASYSEQLELPKSREKYCMSLILTLKR